MKKINVFLQHFYKKMLRFKKLHFLNGLITNIFKSF